MKMMLGLAALVVVAVAGYFGYTTFKAPAQASAPITAVPIAAAPAASAPAASSTNSASSAYGSSPAVPAASNGATFQIDQNSSTARFVIDEILRGTPTTVVGTTNQVAGEIAANLTDMDAAKVGTIRINARTLATDAEGRNRMLQNRILETEQHEFITFAPNRMVGLPETATVGQPITFQMVGDLTIRGTAKEATFDVTLTPTANNRLEGTASTSIKYADWGVAIPQVPSVAGVDEDVALHLDFVATSG
jgi:polyisoprenoid-binding protein YceI